MPELLFELGCEELPAAAFPSAYRQLREQISNRLEEAGLGGTGEAFGTPRRLIARFSDVFAQQEDRSETVRGPGIKAAFAEDGSPTQALLGFCRGQGVSPDAVRREGEHVWAEKHVAGRPAIEVLAEILPQAVRAVSFDKTMRWGTSRMRFARPIRWMLALLDGEVIDFEIEGVRSGAKTYGHRFYSPGPIPVSTFEEFESGLRERKVEIRPEKRHAVIIEGVQRLAGDHELVPSLVAENVHLTEWPTAILGEFNPSFLVLPDPVLVTAMAKHERFFPVRDAAGKLTNQFVSIRNSGEDDAVRKGNEWVLNARFNDALFFFEDDKKYTLDEFLSRTDRMSFHEKLGTIRQRAERLEKLAVQVAAWAGADAEKLSRAAKYCKADLACGLVGELPSLQGVIGGEYALREGFDQEVAEAIAGHYSNTQKRGLSQLLLITDQIDRLVGYIGAGIVPSGSSDPYALRRAASLITSGVVQWSRPLSSLDPLIRMSHHLYKLQEVELNNSNWHQALSDVLATRYEDVLDIRPELVAATVIDPLDPFSVKFRLDCLRFARLDAPLVQAAIRPINIVRSAQEKGIQIPKRLHFAEINDRNLDSAEGVALKDASNVLENPNLTSAELVESIRGLVNPINAFFDKTMVMVDDETVRGERLGLLKLLSDHLLRAGDFTKIVMDG